MAKAEAEAEVPELDDDAERPGAPALQVELPALADSAPHAWNEVNEKQLRSALIGACKRMPRNAEAHFHLGLMYMRKSDGEEALRSFQHCQQIYNERLEHFASTSDTPPRELLASIARLRSHTAQAAHLAAATRLGREERAPLLERLQKDLVAATNLDNTQPDVWNALALLHLSEGGFEGAREVLRSIRRSFPEYLDALNNLGLSELALGNEEAAIACFQKVILCDRGHAEALSNYGVVLLRHGMYDAAARAFEGAVEGSKSVGRGLPFAWGGLAIARGALGKMAEAEAAALEAERTTDPLNRPRFSMLATSIRARRVTEELRRGVASGEAGTRSDEATGIGSSGVPTGISPDSKVGSGGAGGEVDVVPEDPRPAIDSAVLRLRSLAREIGSSSASTALGAVLRLRHDYSWEESGNRNFGAEAAERLVEALEKDDSDAPAWVQLALLQMGTGEYTSARDFAVQAVSRSKTLEAGWNALAVASQLNDEVAEAQKAYEKALSVVRANYNKSHHTSLSRDGDGEVDDALAGVSDVGDAAEVPAVQSDEVEAADVQPLRQLSTGAADEAAADAASSLGDRDLNEAGRSALAAIYNNIGNLKRQEGRSFSEAQAAFEKSLSLAGESAVVYNNLALLYISANRFDDAESMLQHALKLDPHFECALSNQLKLKALIRQEARTREKGDAGGASADLPLEINEDF